MKVPVTNSAEFFGKKCHLEDFGGFGVVRVKKEQKKKIMPVYVNIGILFGEKNINNLE